MLSAVKAYLKVAWALKTPFVFLLDSQYKVCSLNVIQEIYANKLTQMEYIPNFYDCDTYAWVMKAFACQDQVNIVGFVIGRLNKEAHAWNIFLCKEGVFQLEPQTATIFKTDKRYRPWLVIL